MRGLSNSTKELIEYAYRLLVADHPQTLRQLHYAVFSRREIPYENDQADYKRLSRATSVACRAYRAWELESGRDSDGDPPAYSIPADWMVDETRQPETVSVWRDATQYVETVKRSYRRDNWQDQANYCEVWKKRHSWAPSGPSRTPGASRYGCATDSAAPVGAPPCPHSSSHYSSLSYCALPRALKLRKSVGRNLPSTSLCCPGRFELLLSNSVPQAPSITSPVILVGRTGRGNAAGDLRPAGMRLGQCGGEGDAGAGDLCTGRVRRLERRSDGDCGTGAASAGAAASAAGGSGDNRRLLVRATVNGDGLAGAKGCPAGDSDNGRANVGGGAHRGGACRANRRDDGGLEARARINHNRLAGAKVRHAGDFDIVRAGGRSGRQGAGGLQQEIVAVAVGVGAVREAAHAPMGRAGGRSGRPAEATAETTAARAGRRHAAATLPCSGGSLVTLGGPWVDKEAVVEAVDHQARGGVPDRESTRLNSS